MWIYTCAALHPECRFGLISSAHRDAVAAAQAHERERHDPSGAAASLIEFMVAVAPAPERR